MGSALHLTRLYQEVSRAGIHAGVLGFFERYSGFGLIQTHAKKNRFRNFKEALVAKPCTFCQIARLFMVSCASACFAALGVLSVISGLAVPLWVIAGFLVSVAVAIWAIASYLRGRREAASAGTLNDGAQG
jgi:Flp pilus assembly protein TadB